VKFSVKLVQPTHSKYSKRWLPTRTSQCCFSGGLLSCSCCVQVTMRRKVQRMKMVKVPN